MKKILEKSGYSLAEIIVVIIMLGVIAAASLPKFNIAVEKTRLSEGVQILEALNNAQHLWKFKNGNYLILSAGTSFPPDFEITIPKAKTFDISTITLPNSTISTGVPVIATIRRFVVPDVYDYTLTIDTGGIIGCIDGTTVAGVCNKLGY